MLIYLDSFKLGLDKKLGGKRKERKRKEGRARGGDNRKSLLLHCLFTRERKRYKERKRNSIFLPNLSAFREIF